LFIRKSVKKNKFQKIVFITITVLISIGLVVPLAGLFQKPVNSVPQGVPAVQSVQEQLAGLEARAKENPHDSNVLMDLAEAYHRLGKPDQAIKTYEQVLALDPGNIKARYEMAVIYYYSSKYEQAVAQLNEIIKKDPENKEAHLLYGFVLGTGKKDYAAGIQELEKFIDLAKEGQDVEKARQVIEEWKGLAAQK